MSLDAVETAPPAAASEAPAVQRGAGPASARRAAGRGARRAWHRRPARLLLLLAVGAALIGGAVIWWLDARQWVTTDDAFIDVHMVHIAPEVGGRVARVLVDDNQRVKAGQLLVALDPAEYQAKLDRAVALRAAAAGNLAQAKAQRAADIADAEEARAEIGVAEANAANAESQLKRTQSLVERDFASRQQLDNNIAAARGSDSTLVAAQKKLTAAGARLDVAASQIETARANLASAAAQEEEARLDLAYTRVTAPEAGLVAHKSVAVGDYVQLGQNLMAVVPLDVWVTANFKETELDQMQVGQAVEIRIDSYPDKVFHGRVDSFEAGSGTAFSLLPPENATGNYVKVVQRVPVKIVFDEPPGTYFPLGPGMSVVPSVKVR
jgi:membrane fusion protein, multidrug efflux system